MQQEKTVINVFLNELVFKFIPIIKFVYTQDAKFIDANCVHDESLPGVSILMTCLLPQAFAKVFVLRCLLCGCSCLETV